MTHRDLAEKLLKKAEQDLTALEKLKTDSEVAQEILGFHAQQAAEKLLKTVLAFHQVKYPFVHRLAELIDCIHDHQINLPDELEDVRELTPFAVEFRYEFFDEDEEEFDIDGTLELLEKLRDWVKAEIGVTNNDA